MLAATFDKSAYAGMVVRPIKGGPGQRSKDRTGDDGLQGILEPFPSEAFRARLV